MPVSLKVIPAEAETPTHCPYCALQCGMTLTRRDAGWQVSGRDFPTNRGGLCRKGWTSAELLSSPDRLTTPLVRRAASGELSPASWEEAIDFVVNALRTLIDGYGPNSLGVFGGGGLTNEKAYMLGKFARVVLRTKNIDYNGRFCMASAAVANQKVFGIDRGLPFPVSDIPGAEVVFLAGANPAETMPPLMQWFDEQKKRGGRLIVSDPRRTPTAEAATLHLQLTPGTDVALSNGILHLVIREKFVDLDFVRDRTRDFELARRSAAAYWPDRVERITGVPESDLLAAARLLGTAKTAMVLSARGPEQQSHGVDNVIALTNLALALGHAGKPHSGYGCLTGQGNGQGGREHGQKADQLPGYRKLTKSADRQHVAAVWGVDPDELPPPGLAALDLFEALGTRGGIRGLWIMGANPVVSAPNARELEARLARLDLLVVCDPFLSETARRADVVFPVAQWAEEEGTLTNLEGRVLRRVRAQAPPDGVRTDLEVMKLVAETLGRGRHIEDRPSAAFEELRRASAGGVADYAGVSYERIRRDQGVFWPCPKEDGPDTPRLFLERFATPDGRARFFAVEQQDPAEIPDDIYPFFLTTGRLLAHYQSGNQTRRVAELAQAAPEVFVEIHPETATNQGVSDGDLVDVVTRRGRVTCKARLTRTIRRDTLFMPFHFAGEGRANALTSEATDPVSKIPAFKVSVARLERVSASPSSP